MTTATERAYGVPEYEPVPALIINKLAQTLKQIATSAAFYEGKAASPQEAASLRTLRMIAEETIEEYCEPHGYGEEL